MKGDGHCGFRSIALLLSRSQETDAHLSIRKEMLEELNNNKAHYMKYISSEDEFRSIAFKLTLESDHGRVDSTKWMSLGDHGEIITNRYHKLVMVITPNLHGCQTFIPAISKPDPKNKPGTLILCFTGGNHFVPMKPKAGKLLPLPPICPMIRSNKNVPQDIKDSWFSLTKNRRDLWDKLRAEGEAEFKGTRP